MTGPELAGDLPVNTITRPYRGLSVQDVGIPLTPERIGDLLRGREIYRRTAYLALRNGPDTALVAVRPESTEPLMSPVAEYRVLAGPEQTVFIQDPATDVGNATSLAVTALAHARPGALAYLIQGKFEHVNFIWRPAPVRITVTEVIPPHPPKLLAMAEQVVRYDEDLPPIEFRLDAVDVDDLMAANRAGHYLLPCRGSGLSPTEPTSFLDTHPDFDPAWLLIGCERSRQFHRHFYGSEPRAVDLCPRARSAGDGGDQSGLVLTKCCLLERGIEVEPNRAVVPWGSNLDEVRAALRTLCGLSPVPGPAATHPAPITQPASRTQPAASTGAPAEAGPA